MIPLTNIDQGKRHNKHTHMINHKLIKCKNTRKKKNPIYIYIYHNKFHEESYSFVIFSLYSKREKKK